jgi:hypothetical protein
VVLMRLATPSPPARWPDRPRRVQPI